MDRQNDGRAAVLTFASSIERERGENVCVCEGMCGCMDVPLRESSFLLSMDPQLLLQSMQSIVENVAAAVFAAAAACRTAVPLGRRRTVAVFLCACSGRWEGEKDIAVYSSCDVKEQL